MAFALLYYLLKDLLNADRQRQFNISIIKNINILKKPKNQQYQSYLKNVLLCLQNAGWLILMIK